MLYHIFILINKIYLNYSRRQSVTLYQQIYEDLLIKIRSGEYGANSVLPTESRLCADYGVSRITAARALNELKLHGYIERKKKKGSVVLSSVPAQERAERSVAVLFSYFDNCESKISNSLLPFAKKKNCPILLFDTQHFEEKERAVLKYLLSQKIRGLIIWPISRSSNLDILCQFVNDNVPICFMDYTSYGIKAPCVCSDNYGGAYALTEYLINSGHKYVAYFPFKKNFLPTEEERFSAYCRAVIKNGAVLNPDYFIPENENEKNTASAPSANHFAASAKDAAAYLLSLPLPPTAIVCSNDATAYNFILEAAKHGLRVPEDLSVTGFDNTSIAVQNEITTVSQDFGEMAKLALNMIFYQLNNPSLINNYGEINRVRSIIWERNSTRRPQK